jgi:formamidase
VALGPEPKDSVPQAVCGAAAAATKDRCLRTVPPRENGGNMDVKQMQVGTTLYLPCFVKGCMLSIGDVHFAQGGAKDVKRPHFAGGKGELKRIAPQRFHATVGYPLKGAGALPPTHAYFTGTKIGPLSNLSEDLTLAARDALLEMIDWMVKNKGLSSEQAYALASVAVDLRISNVVDLPNYAVSAILDLDVFTGKK